MWRSLYLTKVVINNFRSIKHLILKNIEEITKLIGVNESRKSYIFLSLNWFENGKSLDYNDKTLVEMLDENRNLKCNKLCNSLILSDI